MVFDFDCRTRIVFGPGRFAELGERVASLGVRRALVVSDPGIVAAGHAGRATDLLGAAGLETALFDGVRENPTTLEVEACLAVTQWFRPDVLVAVGGGSSMDCAKGVNFLYSCGGRMEDYWGIGKATGPMLPSVAVPTTAGTGSEAQSFALISSSTTHAKMACGDKRAAFRLALLDPELTLTQPPRVSAITAIDALSHAVETMVSTKRNQLSLAFSREAWRLLSHGVRRVLHEPGDLAARGWVQQGACLAGLAIENSMLGAAHALANPLTAAYGVVHGEAVGLMLPHVVRHNAAHAEGAALAYAELHSELEHTATASAVQAVDELAEFLAAVPREAGLRGMLRELGVDPERLPELAADAARQWTGTFNPAAMTEHDYLRLYEAAF
ncbi:MAG: iron-containing alcohol dehydrogenase [Lacipirellulaceae bacterium]